MACIVEDLRASFCCSVVVVYFLPQHPGLVGVADAVVTVFRQFPPQALSPKPAN